MKDQISDFKAMLYRVQLWLERNPAVHRFIMLAYAAITAILTLLGFFVPISLSLKLLLLVMLILLLLLLLVIDHYHVKMIKSNRFELEQRKRLISELVSTEKHVYRVKYRKEFFDIEPDGDATFTREMILEYDGFDVAWAELLFGTTNDYGSEFEQMIVNAYTFPDTKYPLSRVPIEVTKSRMRFAIILRNKITNTHPTEGFQISMKWLDAWKSLMDDSKDDGILRIDYDTSEYVLELRLPPGYSFVDFRMPRTSGEPIYGNSDDGRAYVTYKLKDLSKGEAYNYFVEITKDA